MTNDLHNACRNGRLHVIQPLIENGADLNAKEGEFGETPLHCACLDGNLEVVMVLIDAGADLHAKDNGGRTALHTVYERGHRDLAVAD